MPRSFPIGWLLRSPTAQQVSVADSTLMQHGLFVGGTGVGKSFAVLGQLAQIALRAEPSNIVVVDPKGELAELWREVFVPALMNRGFAINPEHITAIEPFGPWAVPLGMLVPHPELSPAVQSSIVVTLLSDLVDGMGQRMRGCATWLCRAVVELGSGSLLDVLQMLSDEPFRLQVASQVQDAEVERYLRFGFDGEPAASKHALRARLEWLLQLDAFRGPLCARECLTGSALIESRLTTIDLSGAPLGFSAATTRVIGGYLFTLMSAAILARRPQAHSPRILLVLDEAPELLRTPAVLSDLERLLSQARFVKTGIWACAQSISQIESASALLARSLLANTTHQWFFRPDDTMSSRLASLIRPRGDFIDPKRPDRLLAAADVERSIAEQVRRLRPRQAVFVNRDAASAQLISTLNIPIAELRRRADALPGHQRALFRKGQHGIALAQLLANVARLEFTEATDEQAPAPVSAPPQRAKRPPRRGRPRLVLPE